MLSEDILSDTNVCEALEEKSNRALYNIISKLRCDPNSS